MNDVVFDYRKLKGRIVEKYGTQGNFARVNKMSDRSMSLKLNNGIGLSQKEIVLWCNQLVEQSMTEMLMLQKIY